jgi:hypothetical protein
MVGDTDIEACRNDGLARLKARVAAADTVPDRSMPPTQG